MHESINQSISIHTVSQKRRHYIYACNFAKCWPTTKILSLTDLAVNFLQNYNKLGIPRVQALADISRSGYVVIAMKAVQICQIVHN